MRHKDKEAYDKLKLNELNKDIKQGFEDFDRNLFSSGEEEREGRVL